MREKQKHLLVLTHGREDGGARATLTFALAVSLQAMGCDVCVYLNSQASIWSFEKPLESVQTPGFDSLLTYISLFEQSGGQIYVCSTCTETLIGEEPQQRTMFGTIRKEVVPAGVTTLASLMIERKTLSF